MIINVAINPSDLMKIPKPETSLLFSELARASYLGYHRVFMTNDLAEWVIENIKLSEIHAEQLRLIKERIAESNAQLYEAKCSLVIEIGEKIYIRPDGLHWHISHKNFIEGMTLDQSILLTENALNDGVFYEKIFKIEAQRTNLMPLNFFRFHGGGSELPEIFADLVKYKKLCIAIADQDYYGTKNKNKVGEKLIKNYNKTKTGGVIGLAKLTPGDKIENFLPFEVIKCLYFSTKSQKQVNYKESIVNLEKIAKIIASNANIDNEIWLKLDLKKEFVNQSFQTLDSDFGQRKLLTEYYKSKTKASNPKFDGFGRFNLIKCFLNDSGIEPKSNSEIEFDKFSNSDTWKKYFEAWFESILWFLCGEDLERG